MKRGFSVAYTAFAVLFFLGLGVLFVVRITSVREGHANEARTHYRILSQLVADNIASRGLPAPTASQNAVEQVRGRATGLAAVEVYSADGTLDYLWAENPSYIAGQPRTATQPSGQSLRIDSLGDITFSGSIQNKTDRPLIVKAAYHVLAPRDVFRLLRDSLIAVVAFALVTVLIAVLLMLSSNREEAAPARAGNGGAAGFAKTTSPSSGTQKQGDPGPAARGGTDSSRTHTGSGSEHLPAGDRENEQPVTTPGGRYEIEEVAEIGNEGMFSPVTGVSFEKLLEKRLTLELERAAYNDQDLSLALIQFPGLTGKEESYASAASLVLDRFTFEDLTFEYGKNAFCVIFPNTDLVTCIRQLEQFQKGVAEQEEGALAAVTIGVSSRNGRLVEGNRLITEARGALKKASGGSDRIVGFKPDPTRYRQFVSGRPRRR